jgi:hypothetical protein
VGLSSENTPWTVGCSQKSLTCIDAAACVDLPQVRGGYLPQQVRGIKTLMLATMPLPVEVLRPATLALHLLIEDGQGYSGATRSVSSPTDAAMRPSATSEDSPLETSTT